MPGNRASINKPPTISRIVKRLSRVLSSMEILQSEANDSDNAKVYRKRCEEKLAKLKEESMRLNAQLQDIRDQIDEATLA